MLDERKGTFPNSRPCKMIPKLHTSMAGEDSMWPIKSSGDMYFKEPAKIFSGLRPDEEPNIPKSTILSSRSNLLVFLTLREGDSASSYG